MKRTCIVIRKEMKHESKATTNQKEQQQTEQALALVRDSQRKAADKKSRRDRKRNSDGRSGTGWGGSMEFVAGVELILLKSGDMMCKIGEKVLCPDTTFQVWARGLEAPPCDCGTCVDCVAFHAIDTFVKLDRVYCHFLYWREKGNPKLISER